MRKLWRILFGKPLQLAHTIDLKPTLFIELSWAVERMVKEKPEKERKKYREQCWEYTAAQLMIAYIDRVVGYA